MERTCERVHGLVLSGEKTAWAGWLAGWLARWLAEVDRLDRYYFHHRAMCHVRCAVWWLPECHTAGRGAVEALLGAWWGIWPRRSCDQSEVEMNVSSAPEKVRSRVWVQAWIWRHALRRPGQPEVVSLRRYCGMLRMCGKRERSSAARPGRADSETTDRGGRPNQSRCPPGLGTEGQPGQA